MFLLVISVNHTNTIFKVSLWILLTRKSLAITMHFITRQITNTLLIRITNPNQITNTIQCFTLETILKGDLEVSDLER